MDNYNNSQLRKFVNIFEKVNQNNKNMFLEFDELEVEPPKPPQFEAYLTNLFQTKGALNVISMKSKNLIEKHENECDDIRNIIGNMQIEINKLEEELKQIELENKKLTEVSKAVEDQLMSAKTTSNSFQQLKDEVKAYKVLTQTNLAHRNAYNLEGYIKNDSFEEFKVFNFNLKKDSKDEIQRKFWKYLTNLSRTQGQT